jgi:hypothetical protein
MLVHIVMQCSIESTAVLFTAQVCHRTQAGEVMHCTRHHAYHVAYFILLNTVLAVIKNEMKLAPNLKPAAPQPRLVRMQVVLQV